MKFSQKIILFISFITAVVMVTPAFAVDQVYTGFFSNDAIKGYDTVAYFTENKPVKGSDEFSTEYNGANWLFSSKENLELFLAEPEKYAPQYGGYCAYAVSQGNTASIKPELFTIHEGKLFLNYNNSINEKWRANKAEFIESANTNWPKILAE